jgi:hypothetical protein
MLERILKAREVSGEPRDLNFKKEKILFALVAKKIFKSYNKIVLSCLFILSGEKR